MQFLLTTLVILFSIQISLGQKTKTEIINYSDRQGARASCSFNGCNYFNNSVGDLVSFESRLTAQSETSNARYLFDHPNFKNNKITEIVLELSIRKVINSTGGSTIMQVKVPKNTCNDDIPWTSTSAFSSDLYDCNRFGNIVFEDGIGSTSTSSSTEFLLIYKKGISGFSGSTLQYFDADSDSFTLSFTPLVGGTKISTAKVHITYEDDSLPIPSTPSVTASSNSTSSINLNWNIISNATSYQVFNCNNQQISTTSSNSYTITGLNTGTSYSYKVRATNTSGNSNFSSCRTTTTKANPVLTRPSTPTSFSTEASSESSINLRWNLVSSATSYEVFNCNNQKIVKLTSNRFTVSGLDSGTSYSYKVRAINTSGNSNFTSCKATTTDGCKEEIIITKNINSGEIINDKASSSIIANNEINSGGTASYKAGKTILLTNNFHSKSGSTFSASIENCSSSTFAAKETTNNYIEEVNDIEAELTVSIIELSLYPNPTDGLFTIEGPYKFISYSINDIFGNQLSNQNTNSNILTIDISNLSSGIYLIDLQTENGSIFTKKVIKN